MRLILLSVFCFIAAITYAQPSDRMVHGTTGNIYLLHTVEPKENWYSIGRIYNISPKELAPYNHLSMDHPLSIGQSLKIPLQDVNFSQGSGKENDEVYVPVYHIVQDREWMYRISVNYNKVPIERLEAWNGIDKDEAKAGMKLIVGYLKVKTGLSSLAAAGFSTMKGGKAVVVAPQVTEQRPVARQEPPVTRQETAAPQETAKSSGSLPASEPKTEPVVRGVNTGSGGGYFGSQYAPAGKNTSGTAGIFKSTSGWQDSKYYALMDNVPVGSIIKIASSGGKSVYAKVLGQLADMKDNAGLLIRLSDAAASELGAESASRLSVTVTY